MTSRPMLFVLASLTDKPQTVSQVDERARTLIKATGYMIPDTLDTQSQLEILKGKGLAVRSQDGRWAMRDMDEVRVMMRKKATRKAEEARKAMGANAIEAKEAERIWNSIRTLQERGEFRDRFGFKGGRRC